MPTGSANDGAERRVALRLQERDHPYERFGRHPGVAQSRVDGAGDGPERGPSRSQRASGAWSPVVAEKAPR